MLTIAHNLDKKLYSPRIYVMSASDNLSKYKVEELEKGRTDFRVMKVYRVREVGQSWISTFLYSLPISFLQSAQLIKYNRPSLVSNKKYIKI
jgi:hypothetical protein